MHGPSSQALSGALWVETSSVSHSKAVAEEQAHPVFEAVSLAGGWEEQTGSTGT